VSAWLSLTGAELRTGARRLQDAATPVLFFVVVAALVPLGLDPRPEAIRAVAPGLIWTAALLAALLGLERLFSVDHEDGVLERLLLSPEPLALLVLGKVLAHWLSTGLPVILVAPLVATLLGLPDAALTTLLFSLLLGTPVLALLGAIGAALTVSARRSALLVPVLILPLAVPVLIFGARAVDAAAGGDDPAGALYLLGALCAAALALAPLAIATALRVSLE
jgi:heme exporter protein B